MRKLSSRTANRTQRSTSQANPTVGKGTNARSRELQLKQCRLNRRVVLRVLVALCLLVQSLSLALFVPASATTAFAASLPLSAQSANTPPTSAASAGSVSDYNDMPPQLARKMQPPTGAMTFTTTPFWQEMATRQSGLDEVRAELNYQVDTDPTFVHPPNLNYRGITRPKKGITSTTTPTFNPAPTNTNRAISSGAVPKSTSKSFKGPSGGVMHTLSAPSFGNIYYPNLFDDDSGTASDCNDPGNSDCSLRSAINAAGSDGHGTAPALILLSNVGIYSLSSQLPTLADYVYVSPTSDLSCPDSSSIGLIDGSPLPNNTGSSSISPKTYAKAYLF